MNITDIQEILPHRYPFLLVDRVVELEEGQQIRAYKNVTANEEFFNGHYPGHPVMPGVLIIEAMAQASALLAARSAGISDTSDRAIYLTGVDNARFRRPVVPGDRLDLHVTVTRSKGTVWKMQAMASVDGERAAEADLMAVLARR